MNNPFFYTLAPAFFSCCIIMSTITIIMSAITVCTGRDLKMASSWQNICLSIHPKKTDFDTQCQLCCFSCACNRDKDQIGVRKAHVFFCGEGGLTSQVLKVCKTSNLSEDNTFSEPARQVNRKDSILYDWLFVKQKHNPYERLCFDPYNKQIRRYSTILSSLYIPPFCHLCKNNVSLPYEHSLTH